MGGIQAGRFKVRLGLGEIERYREIEEQQRYSQRERETWKQRDRDDNKNP